MNTPLSRYQVGIKEGVIESDPLQAVVVDALEHTYQAIQQQLLPRAWYLIWQRRKAPAGLYLYGPVGVGKTFLINLMIQSLKPLPTYRGHFHEWMARVHQALKAHQGKRQPLKYIAKQWAARYRVIFLDEFLVNDIADAMILSQWLHELMACGVCLITTSNTAPDKLYANGAQRQRFLPAIALIKKNCQVISLPSHKDYRQHIVRNDESTYYYPCEAAQTPLKAYFDTMSKSGGVSHQAIIINQRAIHCIAHCPNCLWVSWHQLCSIPRSQLDYLSLAQQFKHIIISDIPIIASSKYNEVDNFIKAIDIFYDMNTVLIISADASPDQIYTQGRHIQAFQRTASRLSSLTLHAL